MRSTPDGSIGSWTSGLSPLPLAGLDEKLLWSALVELPFDVFDEIVVDLHRARADELPRLRIRARHTRDHEELDKRAGFRDVEHCDLIRCLALREDTFELGRGLVTDGISMET